MNSTTNIFKFSTLLLVFSVLALQDVSAMEGNLEEKYEEARKVGCTSKQP